MSCIVSGVFAGHHPPVDDKGTPDRGDTVRTFTAPFSLWADRVQAESCTCPAQLYEEAGSGHPFCSAACIQGCCGLLEALDGHGLGAECCKELLSARVFETLGEGVAADWQSISEGLAQRAGEEEEAHDSAWMQKGGQVSVDAVHERLRRASCSSEVAVLMLRLAVRSACLAGSWYGPWESMEALQQLIAADAWASLLRALRALLGTFGPDLSKQYNAINIVSDILHVRPSASSCCFHGWHGVLNLLSPFCAAASEDFGMRLRRSSTA